MVFHEVTGRGWVGVGDWQSTAGTSGEVAIVTDSAASLSPAQAAEYGIAIVPIRIQFGTESYRDGIDITREAFYDRLTARAPHPTTSLPPPSDFMDVYRSLATRAKSVISIHVMGSASGTVQAARMGAAMLPEQDITVFDSMSASMGQGFLALLAARLARLGRTKAEILAALERARKKVDIYGAIASLDYVLRGGRVQRGAALLSSVLKIHPVVRLHDGVVEVADIVRTFPRAVERVTRLAQQSVGTRPVHLAVLHANVPQQAEELLRKIQASFNCVEALVADVGVAIAIHGGPGVLAVATMEE